MTDLAREIAELLPHEWERFMAKVELVPFSTCWWWVGSMCRRSGYGKFCRHNKTDLRAHRAAYFQLVGPIPAGLVLDHLCRNRLCVRPDHLEPVTIWENVRRGVGPSALAARATHCLRGHSFVDGDVYVSKYGYRDCLVCRRELQNRRYHKLRSLGLSAAEASRARAEQ